MLHRLSSLITCSFRRPIKGQEHYSILRAVRFLSSVKDDAWAKPSSRKTQSIKTEVTRTEEDIRKGFGAGYVWADHYFSNVYRPANCSPDSPVILYLPAFHQPCKDPHKIPTILGYSSRCTIYTPTFSSESTPIFPSLLHYVFLAHDHIFRKHFKHLERYLEIDEAWPPERSRLRRRSDPLPLITPPRYAILGAGLGGGLATALSISEAINHKPMAAVGVWNAMVDFSLFPELLKFDYHTGNWIYSPPRDFYSDHDQEDMPEIRDFINFRMKYAKYPEQWLDPFLSPLLYLRTPGYEISLPPDAGFLTMHRAQQQVYRPDEVGRRVRTVNNTLKDPAQLPLFRIVVPAEGALIRTQNLRLAYGVRRNRMARHIYDMGCSEMIPNEQSPYGDEDTMDENLENSLEEDLEQDVEEWNEGVLVVDLRGRDEAEAHEEVVARNMGEWAGNYLRDGEGR
ncbi:hypothetical protein RUND412_004055 [Rhizina undulata]